MLGGEDCYSISQFMPVSYILIVNCLILIVLIMICKLSILA